MDITALEAQIRLAIAGIWPCPNCFGHGYLMDGAYRIGPDKAEIIKPATKCYLCLGKGRVRVMPLED